MLGRKKVFQLKVWDPDNRNADPRRFNFDDKKQRDDKLAEALKHGFYAEGAVLEREEVTA